MGMVKIPQRTSWAKLHGMKKKKKMTISKDSKWVVLSLLKLKDDKCFYRGCGTFQSLIKFISKDMRIIKCKEVKFGAYQGGRSVFLSFN